MRRSNADFWALETATRVLFPAHCDIYRRYGNIYIYIFLYIYVGMLKLSPLMQIEIQISHADCIGVLCSNLPKVDSLLCFVFRIWYFVMARFIEFI